MDVAHLRSWNRWETWLLVPVTIACMMPLWLFAWPPSLDWPHHVAVVDMLARLFVRESAIRSMLVFKLQPVGYHVLYLTSFPFALVFGAAHAVRIVMTALLALHVGVLAWMLRRCRAPSLLALAGVPAFYSAHFAWGALVTMMATPFVMASIGILVGETDHFAVSTRKQCMVATGCACAAGLSHIIFLPVLLLASVLALVLWPRRRFALAASVALGTCLAGAPTALSRLYDMATSKSVQATVSSYVSGAGGRQYFVDIARSIDRGIALQGWQLLWASLLVLIIISLAEQQTIDKRKQQLFLLGMGGACAAMVWYVPLNTTGPLGTAYLLNIRALCLLPALAALLAGNNRLFALAIPRLVALALMVAAAAMPTLGVLAVGRLYDQEVSDYVQKSRRALPKHARLAIETGIVPLGSSWPPLRLSMGVAAWSNGLIFSDSVFLNNPTPVFERLPGSVDRMRAAKARFLAQWQRGQTDEEAVADFWSLADGLFYQAMHVHPDVSPPADRAVQLAAGRQWVLYGPPARARESREARVCDCQYDCAPPRHPADAICLPLPQSDESETNRKGASGAPAAGVSALSLDATAPPAMTKNAERCAEAPVCEENASGESAAIEDKWCIGSESEPPYSMVGATGLEPATP